MKVFVVIADRNVGRAQLEALCKSMEESTGARVLLVKTDFNSNGPIQIFALQDLGVKTIQEIRDLLAKAVP